VTVELIAAAMIVSSLRIDVCDLYPAIRASGPKFSEQVSRAGPPGCRSELHAAAAHARVERTRHDCGPATCGGH